MADMSPLTLHTPGESESDRSRMELRAATTRLNRRIVLAACVVMAELWALASALEYWAAGETSELGWIMGFQLVCFLLAVSVCSGAGVHPPALPHPHTGVGRLRSPQPAAGE